MPKKGGQAMSSVAYTQIYGGASDGDDLNAVRQGDGEAASTFSLDDYAIPDRTPALALFAIVVGLVILRYAWETGK